MGVVDTFRLGLHFKAGLSQEKILGHFQRFCVRTQRLFKAKNLRHVLRLDFVDILQDLILE